MKILLLALISVCPAAMMAEVDCGDGFYCPDGNTCCEVSRGGFGCCPMPNAVSCQDETCCPEGTICLPFFGLCIHPHSSNIFRKISRSLPKAPSVIYRSVGDIPCPGGSSCPSGQTCCQGGCCPYPQAICCTDGKHCCPSGYQCDLTTQMCVQGGGDDLPVRARFDSSGNHTTGSHVMSVASPVGYGIVYCPGGAYYCPDYNTCCPSTTGLWNCCPYPSASCCADRIHCCPAGYRCDATSLHCVTGLFSQPKKRKVAAQPVSNL